MTAKREEPRSLEFAQDFAALLCFGFSEKNAVDFMVWQR